MEFKNRLRKLRLEFNLTQKELGKKVNLAESTISHYEKGIRMPDSAKLEEFANLFDVSIDYLLCRTNNRHAGAAATADEFETTYSPVGLSSKGDINIEELEKIINRAVKKALKERDKER